MKSEEYDYIVVGSGSAGSLVTNRLSKNPNNKILVLEAGGKDNNFWLKLPIGYYKSIFDERFSRQFKTEPSEGSGGRSIIWPRGRVVGGSSSKLFHLKEFAGNLEKKGIECKVVFDSDYADGFPNRKISKWFSTNKKFKKLINEFEPDVI